MKYEKLALKTELQKQLKDVTERLIKNPEEKERTILIDYKLGLEKLIDICNDRKRF